MKKRPFALTSLLLLLLATSSCKTSLKISSPTAAETQRLYSLPPSILVPAGTVVHTTTGDVVMPSDQRLYSEGAYNEQVQRAIQSK